MKKSFINLTVSLSLLFLLLTVNIFAIVSLNEKEFLLKTYKRTISQVLEKNKDLEIKYSVANSLVKIENISRTLDFEKVGRIRYIQVLEGSVASR